MGWRFQSMVKMGVKVAAVTLAILALMWSMDVSTAPQVRPVEKELKEKETTTAAPAHDKVEIKKEALTPAPEETESGYKKPDPTKKDSHEIPCLINGETFIPCRKSTSGEVFMPWRFVKDFFEVSGQEEANGTFSFYNSYASVKPPPPTYSPGSKFMNFGHFNVGHRERVKLITGTEGVPLTTQWNDEGYYYPIQVAQFGLSHHAKYQMEGEPIRRILEDAESGSPAPWIFSKKTASIGLVVDPPTKMKVLEISAPDSLTLPGISLAVPESNLSALSVDLKFSTNGSFSVSILTAGGMRVSVHYILSDTMIEASTDGNDIFIGLGVRRAGQWFHLARDLNLDLMKGLKLHVDDPRKFKRELRFGSVVEVRVHGKGMLDNLAVQSHVHKDQFFDAADWFVRHQDENGGWPIPCPRKLIGTATLQPGWYSAMGQGQAISVLARAYFMTGYKPYVEVAARGLWPYDVDSSEGGVRAVFFDRYVWYEEYPTQPPCFVLNGFIYSLLGVYDFKEVAEGKDKLSAERIYNAGMTSLRAMLGMYDSGVGTLYDLRHVNIGIEPNRARWDYHTTHIELLMQLVIIDGDPLFKKTYKRWQKYMKGIWSNHN